MDLSFTDYRKLLLGATGYQKQMVVVGDFNDTTFDHDMVTARTALDRIQHMSGEFKWREADLPTGCITIDQLKQLRKEYISTLFRNRGMDSRDFKIGDDVNPDAQRTITAITTLLGFQPTEYFLMITLEAIDVASRWGSPRRGTEHHLFELLQHLSSQLSGCMAIIVFDSGRARIVIDDEMIRFGVPIPVKL